MIARKAAVIAVTLALLFTISLPAAAAAAMDDAQSPSPTNDGTTVDQGIAYVLMLLALIVTYIIH